jgi:sigma-B regulation protein RsbU (phosphoserine phosphatase)
MVYGILDVPRRELRYVAAGHPGPLVVRHDGEVVPHDSSGQPIGLLPNASFEERRLTLEVKDRFYLCTDGVTEASSPSGEEFGIRRTAAALARGRGQPLDDAIADLLDEMKVWSGGAPFRDDVSVLAIELGKRSSC